MLTILNLVQEINLVSVRMCPHAGDILSRISLQLRDYSSAELTFLRTVSWLYVLYYEAGKVNISFLYDQLPAYKLGDEKQLAEHLKIVQHMRTFLQHNLDPTKEQNRSIQLMCEEW